jgi:signal peptidase I
LELAPVPSRPPFMGRLWLVVALAVLAPTFLLVALPAMLGLQRYVVSTDAMGDSLPRGSLIFAEKVSGTDLRTGDVITFRPPLAGPGTGYVTRRVASIGAAGIITTADGARVDPWQLPVGGERARVVARVPYVGYPFVGGLRPSLWGTLASVPMLAVLLAVLADLQRSRRRRRAVRRRALERLAGP